jgi:hypothetical protein
VPVGKDSKKITFALLGSVSGVDGILREMMESTHDAKLPVCKTLSCTQDPCLKAAMGGCLPKTFESQPLNLYLTISKAGIDATDHDTAESRSALVIQPEPESESRGASLRPARLNLARYPQSVYECPRTPGPNLMRALNRTLCPQVLRSVPERWARSLVWDPGVCGIRVASVELSYDNNQ